MPVLASAVGALLFAQVAASGAKEADHAPVYETVVLAPAPSREGSFSLGQAQVPAGAVGDPGRAMENAPGVGRLSPGASGLVLWGAAPQESRVLFDGVEIPSLFHFGGWRSIVPAEGVRNVTVRPGGLSADRGRALGGVVEIDSPTFVSETMRAWFAANPMDSSLGAEIPLRNRGGAMLVGRVGYLDRLAGLLRSRDSQALMPMPAYRDLLGKATIYLGAGRALTVEAVYVQDERHLALDAANAKCALVEDKSRDFSRAIVRYTEVDENDTTSAVFFAGLGHASLHDRFGLVPVAQDERVFSVGARLSHTVLTNGQLLEMGIDGLFDIWSESRAGSLTNPPRQGDETVFGAPPGAAVGNDLWHPALGNIAPYALAELHLGDFELRPGLRLDGSLVSSDRVLPPSGLLPRAGFTRTAWSAEPRMAASFAVVPWLSFGAAGGIHHQLPDPADLSPVFGSSSLGPSRAVDGVFSVSAQARSFRLESAGFLRQLDDLPVRNPTRNPPPGSALVQLGRGRAFGAQLLLRRECAERGLCAMLAYTLSRSERRGPADPVWRLSDYDQTHVLTLSLGYRRRNASMGARLCYATGLPRTPVVGAVFDTQAGIFRPVLGAQNSMRLASFVELDLHAERSWRWRTVTFALDLDIVNASDHANAEEIVYSGDFSRHDYVHGLPLLVLAGFRLEI